MKNKILLVVVAVTVASTSAMALPLTEPDFSASITDMGTVFGGVVTLLVAGLGFRFVKRMF